MNKDGNGGYSIMSTDRLKQLVYIGIIIVSISIWYSIFTNGLLTTLLPVCVVSLLGVLIIKFNERNQ